MQRRAFEVTAGWGEVEESDMHPPVRDRLADIRVPTMVLVGALDLDAILETARRVSEQIPDAQRLDWPDTAHLPSLERPDDVLALLHTWLASQPADGTPR
jgi:pimeloyl-ACP methyl ester carboxylesterase